MKLKVIAPGSAGTLAKIFLDEKELNGCKGLQVNLEEGEVNEAVLHFIPSKIEIEGEFKIKKVEELMNK